MLLTDAEIGSPPPLGSTKRPFLREVRRLTSMSDGQYLSRPPESHTREVQSGVFSGQDLSQTEALWRSLECELTVTQLSKGTPSIQTGLARIGQATLATCSTNQSLALSFHARKDSINFAFQAESDAGLRIEGAPRSPHSVIIYSNPGTGHWVGTIPKNVGASGQSSALHVSLPLTILERLALPRLFQERGWLDVKLDPRQVENFIASSRELIATASDERPGAEAEFIDKLSVLLKPVQDLGENITLESPSHYSRIVGLVEALLDESPAPGTLAVGDIASSLSISVRTLQRAFRAMFDIGISRYLQHRRLKRARELIIEGRDPISGVAHRAGFRHTSRFAQQYRRLYGFPPSETGRESA